jgi:4'-phosphopantetheinyl transferase
MENIYINCGDTNDVQWMPDGAGLISGEIHIWRAGWSNLEAPINIMQTFLDEQERARAGRFHYERDRQKFIVRREILKILLARYTGEHPAALVIREGANKKPVLEGNPHLHFNLSSSGDNMLFAIAGSAVGIDIEKCVDGFGYDEIAAEHFSEDERQYIHAAANRGEAFYRLWTRKEALLKATAKGISDDLKYISCAPGRHNVAAAVTGSRHHWSLQTFEPYPGYFGSIAHTGQAACRFFDFDDFLLTNKHETTCIARQNYATLHTL